MKQVVDLEKVVDERSMTVDIHEDVNTLKEERRRIETEVGNFYGIEDDSAHKNKISHLALKEKLAQLGLNKVIDLKSILKRRKKDRVLGQIPLFALFSINSPKSSIVYKSFVNTRDKSAGESITMGSEDFDKVNAKECYGDLFEGKHIQRKIKRAAIKSTLLGGTVVSSIIMGVVLAIGLSLWLGVTLSVMASLFVFVAANEGASNKIFRRSIEYSADFNNIIPLHVKDNIKKFKNHFNNIFVLSEVESWTCEVRDDVTEIPKPIVSRRARAIDPFVIGELEVKGKTYYVLIDHFDLSNHEEYALDEFTV